MPERLRGDVDLVVSNPPYIPVGAQIRDPEVATHDPSLALWSGADGLDAMRVLEARAALLLRPGGVVGAEHADQQGALQLLAGKPYGLGSLWLLGIGFACYALWRLSEAAFGVTGEGNGAGARLKIGGVDHLERNAAANGAWLISKRCWEAAASSSPARTHSCSRPAARWSWKPPAFSRRWI